MNSRLRCFFEIAIDGNNVGQIVFELFNDICPRTCENFRCVCTGEKSRVSTLNKKLYYKECHFHRILKDSMIQSGDLTQGTGTGSESIYGGMFDDENFQIKHDRPYLLSMNNEGPNTNGSQFFITTSKASHLDGKHVVFGYVISGQSVVNAINNIPVNSNGQPSQNVVVSRCGQLVFNSEKNKEEEHNISTTDENENDKKKKKKIHKHKKKKKHRRKKEKHLANISQASPLSPTAITRATVTTTNDQHKKKDSRSYRRRHSSSSTDDFQLDHRRSKAPPPASSQICSPSSLINQSQSRRHRFKTPPPEFSHVRSSSPPLNDQSEIDYSQPYKREYVNTIRTNSASSSSTTKRRKLCKNEEEFNEQQSLAPTTQYTSLNNELRMIAQTSKKSEISSSTNQQQARSVKGRGSVRYTREYRSRSYTPPHWRSADEDRKCRHSNKEKHDKQVLSDEKASAQPKVGYIYIMNQSVKQIFGIMPNAITSHVPGCSSLNTFGSSTSLPSFSSSKSSNKNLFKSTPRPCLVWKLLSENQMEILAITSFDEKDPNNTNECFPSLERSFLLKRLVCLSSPSKLSNEQTILPKLTSNTSYFSKTSYLILIPVIIGRTSSWTRTPIGHFDRNAMHRINQMIVKIGREEGEEQAKLIEGLDLTSSNIDNYDNVNDEKLTSSSSYSIPIKRSDVLDRNSSNDHDKVKDWLSKYQNDMINISTSVSPLSSSEINKFNLYENLEMNNNFIDENDNDNNQSIFYL